MAIYIDSTANCPLGNECS